MIRVRLAVMINVIVSFYAIVTGSKNSPLVKKKCSNSVLTLGIFENILHRLGIMFVPITLYIFSPCFHKSHDTYGTIIHMFTIDHRNFLSQPNSKITPISQLSKISTDGLDRSQGFLKVPTRHCRKVYGAQISRVLKLQVDLGDKLFRTPFLFKEFKLATPKLIIVKLI